MVLNHDLDYVGYNVFNEVALTSNLLKFSGKAQFGKEWDGKANEDTNTWCGQSMSIV